VASSTVAVAVADAAAVQGCMLGIMKLGQILAKSSGLKWPTCYLSLIPLSSALWTLLARDSTKKGFTTTHSKPVTMGNDHSVGHYRINT
jgi:hypothetical protein